jgi:hypothetical protein
MPNFQKLNFSGCLRKVPKAKLTNGCSPTLSLFLAAFYHWYQQMAAVDSAK